MSFCFFVVFNIERFKFYLNKFLKKCLEMNSNNNVYGSIRGAIKRGRKQRKWEYLKQKVNFDENHNFFR